MVTGSLRALGRQEAREWIEAHCLDGKAPGPVGLECEWFCIDAAEPSRAVAPATGIGDLPAGSRVTYEPGGQLELSTPTCPDVVSACGVLAVDLECVQTTMGLEGIHLAGWGADPERPPRRVVSSPRYDAMEAYFDNGGSVVPGAGRRMMCSTAAIQVNVEIGSNPVERNARWHRANALGPVLAAAFANSPFREGKLTGRRSNRLATWASIDPSRTAPADGPDACSWIDYVLGAKVMLERSGDRYAPVTDGRRFIDWIDRRGPTVEDLAYHVTTLFPPVRARGWLELRYLDALPGAWWRVAAAVTVALMDDPRAAACADEVVDEDRRPLPARWAAAAEAGVADPRLGDHARRCLQAAHEVLTDDLAGAVGDFRERFTERGRCPADDQLRRFDDNEARPWS